LCFLVLRNGGFSCTSFYRPPVQLLYLNVVFMLPIAWRCILASIGLATIFTCLIPVSQPKSIISVMPVNCLLPLLSAMPCIHTGFWLVTIYSLTHYDLVAFLLPRPTFSLVFLHGCSLMPVGRQLVLDRLRARKNHRGLIPLP